MSTIDDLFVHRPDSESIAEALQSVDAQVCRHKRNPCIMRCGVQRPGCIIDRDGTQAPWEQIAYGRRLEWLNRRE